MANSITNEKLYYSDINNIILIDPNKTVDSDGNVNDRLVEHENLIMYANLTSKVIPRTKMAVGQNFDTVVRQINIAEINFLGGSVNSKGEKELSTDWTDEMLGSNGGSSTPSVIDAKKKGNTEAELKNAVDLNTDTQLLGITSIRIRNSKIFIPEVFIELEDIQGRALFEKGELSPYSAFFQLPYPVFYLTVKGYYGKAMRYELYLKKFSAKFNPSTGNYTTSLELIGKSPALLSDISQSYLYTLPHMYPASFSEVENTSDVAGDDAVPSDSDDGFETKQSVVTTKGYQKLQEVYSVYKSKGLIAQDFPTMTLSQLRTKLDIIVSQVMKSFSSENFSVISNMERYKSDLNELQYKIISNRGRDSFFKRYANLDNYFVGNEDETTRYYKFKEDVISSTSLDSIKNELKSLLDTYSEKLYNNPVFGTDGSYEIKGKKTASQISFSLSTEDVITEDDSDFNFGKKFFQENGQAPSPVELSVFTEKYLDAKRESLSVSDDLEFSSEFATIIRGKNKGLLKKISQIEEDYQVKKAEIEAELTKALLDKIVNGEDGLGFEPTIRNIFAVIMASMDAFLRLMDDVHVKAWDNRENPLRVNAIYSNGSTSVDNSIPDTETIVYPWPSYTERGDEETIIKYPGNSQSINATKAYNFDVWPEVEFVEEYVRATLEKEDVKLPENYGNDGNRPPYLSANALEFPNTNIPYIDLSQSSFIYEIFERTMSVAYHTRLIKGNQSDVKQLYKVLGDFEQYNITKQITNSFSLVEFFKNYITNYANYEDILRSVSNNGTGVSYNQYIRDIYTKNYINNQLNSDTGIYSINTVTENAKKIDASRDTIKNLNAFLSGTTSSEYDLLDTYPITDSEWRKNNLPNYTTDSYKNFFNVSKVLTFFDTKKVISNFSDPEDKKTNRPFTYFKWKNNNFRTPTEDGFEINNITTKSNLLNFYSERVNDNTVKSIFEGNLRYSDNYDKELTKNQSVSMLNTPFFINSLTKGVDNMKANNKYPFIASGYLFLNSLPLSTTLEKYITQKTNVFEETNYIASTINRFSSIHKLPYYWILKYGSIWHRYKKYVNEGVDILDDVWTDIDVKKLYDPINSDPQKTYDITGTTNSQIKLYNVDLNNNFKNFEVGFYPKLANDMYYLFTGLNIFKDYTNEELNNALNLGLSVYSPTIGGGGFYQTGSENNNFKVTPYFSYLDTSFSSDFIDGSIDYILIPSMGGLNFNQTEFELKNNEGLITEYLENNNAFFNGTIRTHWEGTTFGYFDTTKITKPQPNEYLKLIGNGLTAQESFGLGSEYSNIEEIFSLFDKNTLDTFEHHFLTFVENPIEYNNQQLEGEGDTNIITKSISTEFGKFKYKNYVGVIQELFRVTPSEFSTDAIGLSNDISKSQQNRFGGIINNLLNIDIIYKNGNPGNFNRRLFNTFSGDETKIPVDAPVFETYEVNSLPTDTNATTLSESQTNFPDEWKTLKLVIGEFENEKLSYKDTGSFITDFFVDMNIKFTTSNIEVLSQLIKIYANEKVKNNDLTSADFTNLINEYVTSLDENHRDILNYTLDNVRKNTPNVVQNDGENFISGVDGDAAKDELWSVFKTLDEKWIAGGDYTNKTIFEDFLFFDTANRDIGQNFVLDVYSIKKYLNSKNDNVSVLNLLGAILKDNKFNFWTLPAYVNFYGIQTVGDGQSPTKTPDEVAYDAFGTFLENDVMDSSPKFLCQYIGKPSEHLELNENSNYKFGSDTVYLSNPTDNPLIETNILNKTDYDKSNKLVAFRVDFGIQNQNIFQSINIDQAQHKVTSESIEIFTNLSSNSNMKDAIPQPQSLYNLYKSRSYTCNVQSMGNMMIQPTMYFELGNVPMFTGAYLITNVEHNITTNGIDTIFEGTKISQYNHQKPEKLIATINRSYLERIKKLVKNYRSSEDEVLDDATPDNASETEVTGPCSPENTCNTSLDEVYATVPHLECGDVNETSYSDRELVILTNQVESNTKLNIIWFVLPYLLQNGDLSSPKVTYVNNNLYNISLTDNKNSQLLNGTTWSSSSFTNGKFCYKTGNGKILPLASFETAQKCMEYFSSKHRSWVQPLMSDVAVNGELIDITPRTGMTESEISQLENSVVSVFNRYYETFITTAPPSVESLVNKYVRIYLNVLSDIL